MGFREEGYIFDPWKDESMYDGLDDDEYEEKVDEMIGRYGRPFLWKPGTPEEIKERYDQLDKERRAAIRYGEIID